MREQNGGDGSEPLIKEVHIDAEPALVYAFLTQPEKMALWIGTEIGIDARPGGIFRVVPNKSDVIRGEYVEVEPFNRVSFTWGFEGDGQRVPAGSTIVEITLQPHNGGTLVRLVHRDLSGEPREKHSHGWDHYLSRIKIAAEGGPNAPDPFADPSVRHG